ncbi:MAG: ABC transporter ATP-binding protein [Spirochaetota bacterium]
MSVKDVELVDVTKKFGETVAVDNINFYVEKGEFFSILGPSGCGKTTTLRLISGFELPTEGKILIRERDASWIPPNKRPTNLVFQNLALFPVMNVFENIAFGLRTRRESSKEIRKKVEKMLELVGLKGYGKKRINQLSGGEKQRVAIARCLVVDPTVLLLDEPLGALDLKLREQMKLELKKIHKNVGTTFVYITHDQGEALFMSDRIAVMNKGQLQQIGTPEELYDSPANGFVASFVGQTNKIDGRIEQEKGSLIFTNGQFRAESDHIAEGLKPGRRCSLFIRPEKIDVADISEKRRPGIVNAYEGTVEDKIFMGESVRYLVRLPGEQVMEVMQTYKKGVQVKKVGEKILISWDPGDSAIF